MKFFLFFLCALCVSVVRLPAQSANAGLSWSGSGANTIISGGTNNVAVAATNTYNLRLDVPRADSLALTIRARPAVSNQVTLYLSFARSLDGSTWDNVTPLSVVLTGTTNVLSTNYVTLSTNIPVGSIPYFKLLTLGSPETITIHTNVTLSYGFKR